MAANFEDLLRRLQKLEQYIIPPSTGSTLYVSSSDSQSVDGVKTFTESPLVPDPTTATGAANKEYVDDRPTVPARVIISGHSWASYSFPTAFDVHGGWYGDGEPYRDRQMFAQHLWDLLGMPGPTFYRTQVLPLASSGGTQSTLIGPWKQDGLLEAVSYFPYSSVTGANTNYLQLGLAMPSVIGWYTIGNKNLTSGNDLTGQEGGSGQNIIWGPLLVGNFDYKYEILPRDSSDALTQGSVFPYTALFELRGGQCLEWVQTQHGTGLDDPGGIVVARVGDRCRNLAVGGSAIAGSSIISGGWATFFAYDFDSEPPGAEVSVATTYTSGGTMTVSALPQKIPNGARIEFANGEHISLAADANYGATSLSVTGASGTIPAGQHGMTTNVGGAGMGSSPKGTYCFMDGLNDVTAANFETGVYAESQRAKIAHALCSYYQHDVTQAKFQYDKGNAGAFADWQDIAQPTCGQYAGTSKRWVGALGSTKPTITITLAPNFEGGTYDLFFVSICGTGRGGTADIAIDGQYAATVDTNSVATFTNISTVTCTTTSGSATLVGAGGAGGTFTVRDIGKWVTGTGIEKGTRITGYTDSTHVTLNQNMTSSGGSRTITLAGYVPMVKRFLNLAAGTHTIVITVTSIAATDSSAEFLFYGDGWESVNPTTTVIVPTVAACPVNLGTLVGVTDDDRAANIAAANLSLAAVFVGAMPAPGTGTIEPALPSSCIGIDLEAVIPNDVQYYIPDGIHPNSRGAALIAEAFVEAMKGNTTLRSISAR